MYSCYHDSCTFNQLSFYRLLCLTELFLCLFIKIAECPCASWANTPTLAVLWHIANSREAQCLRVSWAISTCCQSEQKESSGKLVGWRQTGVQWGIGRSCQGKMGPMLSIDFMVFLYYAKLRSFVLVVANNFFYPLM